MTRTPTPTPTVTLTVTDTVQGLPNVAQLEQLDAAAAEALEAMTVRMARDSKLLQAWACTTY
tara:strand:- start:914 stop:1099 length:186 start_codon:yes stop_codon:yes gene_type:complete|eukprot:scaffold110911_cov36-Phaeocystis_antarctica.AAC.1